MKKAFFLAMMVLFIVCCATMVVKPISLHDLKDLKGEWTGNRTSHGRVAKVDLKINNDRLPLQGEVTLHWPNRAPITWVFNGRIENGHLILFWRGKTYSMDLRLREGDSKMELNGYVLGLEHSATVVLRKIEK